MTTQDARPIKIEVKNLTKRFGDLLVLDDMNFTIRKGEFLAIVGPTGCGKTTLGKIITGLYRPTSGDVYFGGERVSGTFDKKLSSYNQVQFIQQDSMRLSIPFGRFFRACMRPLRRITANGRKSRSRTGSKS